MFASIDGDHIIGRQRTPAALQELLQSRLGILGYGVRARVFQASTEQAQHQLPRICLACIEQHCTDKRLNGVGQDGFPAVTATLHFPGTQAKIGPKLQSAGDLREGLAANEGRSEQRERVFLRIAMPTVELVSDDVTEKGVT